MTEHQMRGVTANTAPWHQRVTGCGVVVLAVVVAALCATGTTAVAPTSTTLQGVLPANTLTHFCIITSWENYNQTLDR